MSARTFTDRQGQYLAFIDAYARVNGRPPAESDIQRRFGVSPPSVHQMVLTLERLELIRRRPGVARSIEVLLAPEDSPVLRHIALLVGAIVAQRLGAALRLSAGAAAAGLVVSVALTVWPEIVRLGLGQPGAPWPKRLGGFDARVAFACAVGFLGFAGAVRLLRRTQDVSNCERP